jgi:hypothetical protein
MTSPYSRSRHAAPAPERRLRRAPLRIRKVLALAALMVAFSLAAVTAIAPPPPPTADKILAAYIDAHAQKLVVADDVAATVVKRTAYSATAGIDTFIKGGTNHDWAKLVLLAGGWPITDNNVTVLLRWMRQENGANNWWNRNNPLNNGFGSGGAGGTGHYANLVVAAQKAAENLHRHPGFAPIAADFLASASTEVTEQAIWASPWATGHYANGGHWHYTPVEVVTAPADAWL